MPDDLRICAGCQCMSDPRYPDECQCPTPCASCGEPGYPEYEVNNQPRCREHRQSKQRWEGRRSPVSCWCGAPRLATGAMDDDCSVVCTANPSHPLDPPNTGPAWRHEPEPGAARRDAVAGEIPDFWRAVRDRTAR